MVFEKTQDIIRINPILAGRIFSKNCVFCQPCNQPKKAPKEIFRNADNLTFGSGTADTAPAQPIPPLPSRYCPCPPIQSLLFRFFSENFKMRGPSQTPILFRFFSENLKVRVPYHGVGVKKSYFETYPIVFQIV